MCNSIVLQPKANGLALNLHGSFESVSGIISETLIRISFAGQGPLKLTDFSVKFLFLGMRKAKVGGETGSMMEFFLLKR